METYRPAVANVTGQRVSLDEMRLPQVHDQDVQ